MSDITLYHNPRCSKSRAALQLLQARGIEPGIRLYLETPPSREELSQLLERLGIGARGLLRTGEAAYKEENLEDPSLTEAQLIEAMIAHPKLIERPIAIRGERAVVGRPPENVLELL
jgi:arsenate reductase